VGVGKKRKLDKGRSQQSKPKGATANHYLRFLKDKVPELIDVISLPYVNIIIGCCR
jgi:hypothetical protein